MKTQALHKRSYKLVVDSTSMLLMMLFVYASVSKLLIVDDFQGQLMQSPLMPRAAIKLISIGVPAIELIVVFMLLFRRTIELGFYLSFFLMLSFTLYLIALVVTAGDIVPCSCGGILGQLDFGIHIVFNVVFCAFSVIGLYFLYKHPDL